MFKTFANAWKIPDLKRKLLFTLFIIIIYRIGVAIPVPYLIADLGSQMASSTEGSIFQYLNILSGNAFSQATLFALGISPYITSSIVIQLLAVAIPALEKMSKDGEEGKKKLNQITRYVTVGLGLLTSTGYYFMLKNNNLLTNSGWFEAVVIIACYCAGSALVMWIAEKINESGIGNGISIILLANIVASGPSIVSKLWSLCAGTFKYGEETIPMWLGIILAVIAIVVGLAMIGFIVWMTNSERRLPVQYAKKVVGRKMYGGQSSTLPIKLNMTGVMPIIFANSMVTIPSTIAMFAPPKDGSLWSGIVNLFGSDSWLYAVLTAVLIIAFAFFYIAISFNPIEVANNLKTNGGFVPGIRPGRPTAEYITKILNRITLIGAIMLGAIAILPLIVNIASGGNLSGLAFGGSSIIIVVGVVLETAREIEGQMMTRHYKGFLE